MTIIFMPFDIVQLKKNKAIGMVLPCGKVITFEKVSGRDFIHHEAQRVTSEDADPVDENNLTAEKRIAIIFARAAFEINEKHLS